jgi:Protein of unknown function (DUF3467)
MPEEPKPNTSAFARANDFRSVYSNNVQLENSVWDLKLIFGILDQRHGKQNVEQHTSVSMNWIQAKLLIYFLQMSMTFFEAENGLIKIPPSILPPDLGELPQDYANNPGVKAAWEAVRKLRQQLAESSLKATMEQFKMDSQPKT